MEAIVFCFLFLTPAYSQSEFFSDESFVIADFSNERCTKGQILSAISGNETGVCLRLIVSEDSSELYIQSKHRTNLSFDWLVSQLLNISDKKRERIKVAVAIPNHKCLVTTSPS